MKYLLTFNEKFSIWDDGWREMLPDSLTIYKGQIEGLQEIIYNKGNVMIHYNMLQITYDTDGWAIPDTFEIDIYFVEDDAKEMRTDLTHVMKSSVVVGEIEGGTENIRNLRLDVDMTFGDQMACEFSLSDSGVSLIQHSTKGSKFDPTDTIFALSDESLKDLIDFFNSFNLKRKFEVQELHFLEKK
jgi:hypothetical protein